MTNASKRICLVAAALSLAICCEADAQGVAPSPPSARQLLFLNFTNNGQYLSAAVSQQIEISLGSVGGPQYGKPEVSSPAIRLESTALSWPPTPAGPSFTYIFKAEAEGEARVAVPIIFSDNPEWAKQHTFAVTIQVRPAPGNWHGLHASLTPDQSNTEPWQNAWTNLKNAQQSFVPSLPKLTGVEVELVVANRGSASDEVTMTLTNAEGVLAVISKTVPVAQCSHVLFLFPRGGYPVSPGQVYNIVLNGDGGVFGWKYVADGYRKGTASLDGKPLSRNTRRSFLFRTFGAN